MALLSLSLVSSKMALRLLCSLYCRLFPVHVWWYASHISARNIEDLLGHKVMWSWNYEQFKVSLFYVRFGAFFFSCLFWLVWHQVAWCLCFELIRACLITIVQEWYNLSYLCVLFSLTAVYFYHQVIIFDVKQSSERRSTLKFRK